MAPRISVVVWFIGAIVYSAAGFSSTIPSGGWLRNRINSFKFCQSTPKGINGAQNGISGAQNGISGAQNGISGAQNGISGAQNGVSVAQNSISGAQNGISVTIPVPSRINSAQKGLIAAQNVVGAHSSHNAIEFAKFWKTLCDNIDKIATIQEGYLVFPEGENWYHPGTKKLYVRQCYKDNAELFFSMCSQAVSSENIVKGLMVGTSGVGKSTFLFYLLTMIVKKAKEEGSIAAIVFSFPLSDGSAIHLHLTTDGGTFLYDHIAADPVDYHFSDSIDIFSLRHVRKGALVVTSEKSKEHERFDKSDNHRSISIIFPSPVWSFEELSSIVPAMTDVEKNLRFAIFGGNPRNFYGSVFRDPPTEKYGFISDMMSEYFPQEKLALSPTIWKSILGYLVTKISNSANQEGEGGAKNTLRSLMWHTSNAEVFFWASRFMEFIGNKLLLDGDETIKTLLTQVIGRSGFGNLFEYQGHKALVRSNECYRLKGLGAGTASIGLSFIR